MTDPICRAHLHLTAAESALYTIGTHERPINAKTVSKRLRDVGLQACQGHVGMPPKVLIASDVWFGWRLMPPEYFHRGPVYWSVPGPYSPTIL